MELNENGTRICTHDIVASFWHGRPWSKLEQAAANSYLASGYEYIVYSYKELNLPDGVKNLDARFIWDIDPSTIKKHCGLDSYGPFADLFRYKLMDRFDGITVVDADQFCLKRYPESDVLFGKQKGSIVAMGVMRAPNKSSIMTNVNSLAKKFTDCYHLSQWSLTGPLLITQAIREAGQSHRILPSIAFYPISADIKIYPFTAESNKWTLERFIHEPRTFGLQLWSSGVQYIAKNSDFKVDFDKPVKGSFYEKLCDYFL